MIKNFTNFFQIPINKNDTNILYEICFHCFKTIKKFKILCRDYRHILVKQLLTTTINFNRYYVLVYIHS